MDRISVIVPVYNSEKYLTRCVESILRQTYTALEIILVNDGSTDSSLELCRAFAEKDARIIVVDQANKGLPGARNAGLDIATGDFIGFVDSDDHIAADMFERLAAALVSGGADYAECGYFIVEKNRTRTVEFRDETFDGGHDCAFHHVTLTDTAPYAWNKLYKRILAESLRYKAYYYGEDFYHNLEVSCNSRRKVNISGCYYYYMINEDSITNRPFSTKKLDILRVGTDAYSYLGEKYPELCTYAAQYICHHSMACYYGLAGSGVEDKQKHIKDVLKKFRHYYPLISAEVYRLPKFKKLRRLYLFFGIHPKLYDAVLHLYLSIRR